MTRRPHAKFARTLFCGVAFALALGGFQIAHAASLSKASTGIPYRTNGKTTTFGEGSQIARPNATVPSGSEQIGQSGWYRGTGAQVNPASGQTMNMGANGDVYFSGTKYPFQAGYQVPAKEIGLAALGLVGGWPGLAISATLVGYPYIKDWFDKGGVRPADGGGFEVKSGDNADFACNASANYTVDRNHPAIGSTANNGCGVFPAGNVFLVATSLSKNTTQCRVRNSCHESVIYGSWSTNRGLEDGWLPASMDDIAPYLMRTPFDSRMIDDVIQGGGTINLPSPNITGPATVQGSPTTNTTTGTQTINGQQVPTRTETTTQTTYNFTTNNNQVTNTTNNTTTTTNTYNQSTGVLIGTSTSVTDTKPEEKDDRSECEKNPKQLNCSDLDTPGGEIPKSTASVTYSIEDSWGGGSCPADVYAVVGGHSVKAYDWQQTCGYVSTYVRPILLLLCAFGALLIVMPGKADS